MDSKQKSRHIAKRFGVVSSHDSMPFALSVKFDRNSLHSLYKDLGFKIGAEVGVSRGKHSQRMCKAIPGLELYCIDPYVKYKMKPSQEGQDRIHAYACKILSPYNVHMIRKTSMEAVKEFEDESLDFVYIDGNHKFDFFTMDLISWGRKVKKGGIIACHDYCHFHWSGIVRSVDAYTYCHDIRPWFITKETKPTAFWVKP